MAYPVSSGQHKFDVYSLMIQQSHVISPRTTHRDTDDKTNAARPSNRLKIYRMALKWLKHHIGTHTVKKWLLNRVHRNRLAANHVCHQHHPSGGIEGDCKRLGQLWSRVYNKDMIKSRSIDRLTAV
jgi:hypothetical protein